MTDQQTVPRSHCPTDEGRISGLVGKIHFQRDAKNWALRKFSLVLRAEQVSAPGILSAKSRCNTPWAPTTIPLQPPPPERKCGETIEFIQDATRTPWIDAHYSATLEMTRTKKKELMQK